LWLEKPVFICVARLVQVYRWRNLDAKRQVVWKLRYQERNEEVRSEEIS